MTAQLLLDNNWCDPALTATCGLDACGFYFSPIKGGSNPKSLSNNVGGIIYDLEGAVVAINSMRAPADCNGLGDVYPEFSLYSTKRKISTLDVSCWHGEFSAVLDGLEP